jgi:hypothetical protein
MRPTYRCTLKGFTKADDGCYCALVIMRSEHEQLGDTGDRVVRTSAVQSADFVHGLLVTRNSIYQFKPWDI